MIDVIADAKRGIELGRVGENKRTRVIFDLSEYVEEYPNGSYVVLNKPSGSSDGYPVASIERDGTSLYWVVLSSDVSVKGRGCCELVVYDGDVVAKSTFFATNVRPALGDTGDIPKPWHSWQEVLAILKSRVDTVTGTLEHLTAKATTLPEGSDASAEYSEGVLTIGVPKGDTGETGAPGTDGVSPTITVTDITGGHRVTITDATGAHSFDVMDGEDGQGAVQDVQVNGVSVLSDGVANVQIATASTPGVVIVNGRGLAMSNAGVVQVMPASSSGIKTADDNHAFSSVKKQHESTFFGLSKAAGDTTQSQSSNAVGQYTESAKSAISTMLNGPVTVSGTTPSITALPGIQYVCGECATLDITLPASGIVDVVFTSGSTPTVLTITPPTGITEIEWADRFDPDNLSANATYWLKVIDGKLGVATAWGLQSSGGGEEPWNHAHFEVTDASEQTTAFIVPNNKAVSEILVRGKALFDGYDGLAFFINNIALLAPNGNLSETSCYFQLYGKRIAADMWIGRGNVGQWGVAPQLLEALAKSANNASVSDGIGDIKIASRWTNKIYQVGTDIDVYWR